MTHEENEAVDMIINTESAYFMARYFGQTDGAPVKAMREWLVDNDLGSPHANYSSRAVQEAIDISMGL